jgi:hypothetical protein
MSRHGKKTPIIDFLTFTESGGESRKRERSPDRTEEREPKRRGTVLPHSIMTLLAAEPIPKLVPSSAKQPADLEELLETQRNEEGGAKVSCESCQTNVVQPKFLSKAQRRTLALQKRQDQVNAVRQQQDQERQARAQFIEQAKELEKQQRQQRM